MEAFSQLASGCTCEVITSSGESWKGFTVDELRLSGPAIATPDASKHVVMFNWSDQVSIQVAGVQGECDKGSIVCLTNAGVATECSWEQPAHFLLIRFSPGFIDEVTGIIDFRFAPQRHLHDSFLLDIATRLRAAASQGFPAEKLYAESLGVACAVHLAGSYRASGEGRFLKGRLTPYQLKQVVDYAYSYMQFNIGLHELAGTVHLSPYHFGRLFKQTIGLSPYQYVLQLKIECAKRLIKKQQGPISEIAYQLNFSDQSHFSNAFRKATGVSPREYLYS